MFKDTKTYPLRNVEGEFRFASEFTQYQPANFTQWQAFYFKHFGKGSTEQKSLPLKLNIKRLGIIQEINIIQFINGEDFTSEFFTDYDHYIMIALVDLPTQERVIIPCF